MVLDSPRIAPCLFRPRERKGGTLIAEDVTTLREHRARVCAPGGYRPTACGRCGHGVLHVHDYRGRLLAAFVTGVEGTRSALIDVVRYVCARRECGAIWQVLPALVARHLWRAWGTVESATLEGAETAVAVPRRTRERWASRLLSPALLLVQMFATEAGSRLETLAKDVGLEASRAALVLAYAAAADVGAGMRLARVAAVVHRLSRGIRLM